MGGPAPHFHLGSGLDRWVDDMGRKPKYPATEEERQRAICMVAQGLSYRAIGRILGRSPETIRRWALATPEEVRQMHEQLKREFAAAAWAKAFEILSYLTPEKLERMGGRDLVTAAGILFDKATAAMGDNTQRTESITERREVRVVIHQPEPRTAARLAPEVIPGGQEG